MVAPSPWSACAALAGLWHLGDIALLLIAAAASVGWVMLCARAERTGDHEWAPLAVFGVAVGLLILLSGWDSDVAGPCCAVVTVGRDARVGVSPDRLLMVIGVVLLQFVTGNQLVRLVLGSVGAVKPDG